MLNGTDGWPGVAFNTHRSIFRFAIQMCTGTPLRRPRSSRSASNQKKKSFGYLGLSWLSLVICTILAYGDNMKMENEHSMGMFSRPPVHRARHTHAHTHAARRECVSVWLEKLWAWFMLAERSWSEMRETRFQLAFSIADSKQQRQLFTCNGVTDLRLMGVPNQNWLDLFINHFFLLCFVMGIMLVFFSAVSYFYSIYSSLKFKPIFRGEYAWV